MNNMYYELKPCPFAKCKSNNVHVADYGSGDSWAVECLRCGCRGPVRRTKGMAIKDWNLRIKEQKGCGK